MLTGKTKGKIIFTLNTKLFYSTLLQDIYKNPSIIIINLPNNDTLAEQKNKEQFIISILYCRHAKCNAFSHSRYYIIYLF